MTGSVSVLQKDFSRLAMRSEDQIDLARAALLIARLGYPELDEAFYLAALEDLAARLRERVSALTDIHLMAARMIRLLFEEEGFKGNHKDYYDPDNSYLNRVLDLRMGIPITLSLVCMEVGRRAGLKVCGIGMPGHFVIGLYGEDERILMDPFNRGAILDEDECRRRVALQYGGSKIYNAHDLDPVGPKKILARLLRNLKGVYRQMGDLMGTLQALEWIIALDPNGPVEYRERGFLYEGLGAFDRATKDLEKYLALSPDAEDAETIRSRMESCKEETSRFH